MRRQVALGQRDCTTESGSILRSDPFEKVVDRKASGECSTSLHDHGTGLKVAHDLLSGFADHRPWAEDLGRPRGA